MIAPDWLIEGVRSGRPAYVEMADCLIADAEREYERRAERRWISNEAALDAQAAALRVLQLRAELRA